MGGTKSAMTVASLQPHHHFGNAHGVEQHIPCVQPHVPRISLVFTRSITSDHGGQSMGIRAACGVRFGDVMSERARGKMTGRHITELERCRTQSNEIRISGITAFNNARARNASRSYTVVRLCWLCVRFVGSDRGLKVGRGDEVGHRALAPDV
jgi:hypothetical protein